MSLLPKRKYQQARVQSSSPSSPLQRYICKSCKRLFKERTGTPLAYIQKPVEQVERVLKMRSEGMGLRAAGRVGHWTELQIGMFPNNWSSRLIAEIFAQAEILAP